MTPWKTKRFNVKSHAEVKPMLGVIPQPGLDENIEVAVGQLILLGVGCALLTDILSPANCFAQVNAG